MRLTIIMALLMATGASADMCPEVEERSGGRIECIKDDFGYTLKYSSGVARRLTLASGRYDQLISSLCHDSGGGVVRESWKPLFSSTELRTTTCQTKKEPTYE